MHVLLLLFIRSTAVPRSLGPRPAKPPAVFGRLSLFFCPSLAPGVALAAAAAPGAHMPGSAARQIRGPPCPLHGLEGAASMALSPVHRALPAGFERLLKFLH